MKYLVQGCKKAISAELVHSEEIQSPDVVKQKEEDTGLARHRGVRRLQQCYSSCAGNPAQHPFPQLKNGGWDKDHPGSSRRLSEVIM